MSKSKKKSHKEKVKAQKDGIKTPLVQKPAKQNSGVDEAQSDGSASGFSATEMVKE